MKSYFKKNKLRASITAVISLCLVLALAVFAVYKFPTLAGLFQKDKDGKVTEKKVVTILEIVAQNGQQIIGYTVDGQEPITKEKIEQYHGDIDINDFKNATGYVLEKTPSASGYNYTVKGDVLSDTFNQNVLGGNMTDDGDQIIVKVVQAKDFVESDLDDADLVYLNSADSNANLLYYYDQIMNDGKGNIEAGTYGATYADSYIAKEDKQKYALRLIAEAAGKPAKAALLTKQTYKWAGLENFSEIYIDNYNSAIGALSAGIYNKTSETNMVKSLQKLMTDAESTANAEAFEKIKPFSQKGTITDEERSELKRYLQMYDSQNVFEVNLDEYVNMIISQKISTTRSLNSAIALTNKDQLKSAVMLLKENKEMEDADYSEIESVIGKVMSEDYNELNKAAYAKYFASDDFVIDGTLSDSKYGVKVGEIFKTVNEAEKDAALNTIAQAPMSDENMVNLSADASRVFELAELKGYDEELLDKYLDGISKLDDKKKFLIQKEVEQEQPTTKEDATEETTTVAGEEGTTDNSSENEETTTEEETTPGSVFIWTYNKDAIENFIEKVNAENNQVDVAEKYDMMWESAMALYDYAMVQERGFMYNTDLLEKHSIGDYTTSDVEQLKAEGVDNTNNVYKMLLVLRQLTPNYYNEQIRTKIDSEGYYFTAGLNENGEGITSDTDKGNNAWYKGTFLGSDSTNAEHYREPDVVGKVYAVGTGGGVVQGPTRNYVNKKTYSFSGDQFLGGETFVSGKRLTEGVVSDGSSAFTQDTFKFPSNIKPVIVNIKNASNRYKNCYVHFWKSSNESYNNKLIACDSNYNNCLYGYETKNYNSFLFTNDINWKGNQTDDVKNIDLTKTNYFTISSYTHGTDNKNYVSNDNRYEENFGFYAKPGANKEESTVNFIEKLQVDLYVRGCTSTKYDLIVDGKTERTGEFGNGDKITIGEGDPAGSDYTIKLYDAAGGVKKYNYRKQDSVIGELNYTSKSTASNNSKLSTDNTQPTSYNTLISGNNTTKGDIIEYIMGIEENVVSLPYKVLVIEPVGGVTELDDYASAQYLAKSLKFDYSGMNNNNYKDYIKVTCMGVREFNTRKQDLTSEYDLIYFGTDSGAMSKYKYESKDGKSVMRTYFRDKSMDGLVYTGIGDLIKIRSGFRGTAADDYTVTGYSNNQYYNSEMATWRKFFFAEFQNNTNPSWNLNTSNNYVVKNSQADTRLCGNDITVDRMNELLDYVKAGYPVMFGEGLINSDEYVTNESGEDSGSEYKSIGYDKAVRLRYLDKYSKLYNFIEQAKKLGYDEASGTYTGFDANGNQVFKDGRKCASLVKYEFAKSGKNPDYLDNDHKFDGGLAFAAKRNLQVDFKYVSGPQQYHMKANSSTEEVQAGTIGNMIGDQSRYTVKLQLATDVTMKYVEDNYEIQMYLDKTGTGSFEGNTCIEIDPSYKFNEKDNTVTISGKWPGDLEGFIPWKIVVYNKQNNENKWTYTGYSAFKCSEQKPVNVLWVRTNGNHLDFDQKLAAQASNIHDYKITTYVINYKDFVAKWNNESSDKVYDENSSLLKVGNFSGNVSSDDKNKAFDMIVFGYCDSYAGLDINSVACLNNIDYFVNVAKHSLLFAHDNAGWRTSYNYYTANNASSALDESGQQFARYTTSYMRGMLGMDYYGASFSPLAFNPSSTSTDQPVLKDLYLYNQGIVNSRMYLNPSLDQSDFRGYQDGHLLRYDPSGKNDPFWPYRANSGTGNAIGTSDKGLETTTSVKRTNQGQITMYPFNIGEKLKVSTTHFQYTRLNMEDSDVTVWYTLDAGSNQFYGIMGGDGSNNFYIYSKGNITYTGAGHSTVNEDTEIKLFINTVVAAIKVGSSKPVVEYTNASKTSKNGDVMYAYDTDDSFEVRFVPRDYDNKKGANCFTDCKIFIDVDNDGKYNENVDKLLNGANSKLRSIDDNSVMQLNGPDLHNREEMAYKITYQDIAMIGMEVGEIANVHYTDKSDVYNKAMEFLSKHKVCTQVVTQNINQYGLIETKESDVAGFTVAKKKFNYLN